MKSTPKKQTEIEAESRRRTLQILRDEKAMEGVREALAEVQRGERGVPSKELTRKYKRA
jgi:PHD/YefM family antitoxin component YafN of YafNO toxin-antitoxin module